MNQDKEICYSFTCYDDEWTYFNEDGEKIVVKVDLANNTTKVFTFFINERSYSGWIIDSCDHEHGIMYPAQDTWDGWNSIYNLYLIDNEEYVDKNSQGLLYPALTDKEKLIKWIKEEFPERIKEAELKW